MYSVEQHEDSRWQLNVKTWIDSCVVFVVSKIHSLFSSVWKYSFREKQFNLLEISGRIHFMFIAHRTRTKKNNIKFFDCSLNCLVCIDCTLCQILFNRVWANLWTYWYARYFYVCLAIGCGVSEWNEKHNKEKSTKEICWRECRQNWN